MFKALYKIALQYVTVHLPAASDLTDTEHHTKKEARDLLRHWRA